MVPFYSLKISSYRARSFFSSTPQLNSSRTAHLPGLLRMIQQIPDSGGDLLHVLRVHTDAAVPALYECPVVGRPVHHHRQPHGQILTDLGGQILSLPILALVQKRRKAHPAGLQKRCHLVLGQDAPVIYAGKFRHLPELGLIVRRRDRASQRKCTLCRRRSPDRTGDAPGLRQRTCQADLILVPYGFRIIPLIKILQLDAVVYQRCVGTPSRKGVLSVHGAGKDGPVQAPEDVTLIPRISKRNDPRAPARQIGFLPQLHGIELVTVENHLFPPALELDSVGKQLRIMKVIKVCVYGQCRLIHFAGKGGHPGKPPAGGLSHTDDPDTGVLPALSPLHQKNLVTGLCQRDALLLKNTRVSRLMGTGHMAYFDHS